MRDQFAACAALGAAGLGILDAVRASVIGRRLSDMRRSLDAGRAVVDPTQLGAHRGTRRRAAAAPACHALETRRDGRLQRHVLANARQAAAFPFGGAGLDLV
eukprot:scaffold22513_cov107-Isochrysis_galbana.AAC.3